MWYKRFAPSKNWNTGSFQCVDPVYIVLDPGSLFFYTCLSRPSLGDPFKPCGIKTLLSTRVRFKYVSPFLDPPPLSVMWNFVLRNTGPEKETFLYQCGIMFLGEKPMKQTRQITIEKIGEPEIKNLVKIVKKALNEYRKYLPKDLLKVETWIIGRLTSNGYSGCSFYFTFLDNRVKSDYLFKHCENVSTRELAYLWHDLMITIEKRTGEKIQLIFRIHDLRTIEYFDNASIRDVWIYYGKIELRDYYIYA